MLTILLPRADGPRPQDAGGHAASGDAEPAIQRMILMRWLASGAAFATVGGLSYLLPERRMGLSFAFAALVPLSNLVHLAVARRFRPRAALLGQFVADLCILTAILCTLGGIDGPLLALFILHVLLGSLLLERRDAIRVGLLALGLANALGISLLAGAPFPPGAVSQAIGLSRPLNAAPTFVLSTTVMLNVVAAVLMTLVLPLVEAGRSRARQLAKAEADARGHADILEMVLDNVGAMMMVLDDTHHLLWLNRVARTRFPAMKVGGIRRCFDPAEPMGGGEPTACPSCHVIAHDKPWSGDYAVALTDAEPIVLRVYANPVREGGRRLVVELIIDVTAERRAQKELLAAQKTGAIAVLAAGVAHELNTPLATLAAGLRTVQRMCVERCGSHAVGGPDSPLELVDELRVQTARCQQTTESMLAFGRQLRSHLVAAEIEDVVREALAELGKRRDLTGIEVVFAGAGPEVPTVRCDPDHLRLTLVNLLCNAIDSLRPANRTKPRVHVEVCLDEAAAVVIHVRDNGVGMPEEVRDAAFDPFFTTKTVGQGSGLGLPLSQGLVQGMGGSIRLESAPNQGTHVWVVLPAGAPEPSSDLHPTA